MSVDWAQFLHRHDLKWDWVWGSTKASTLSPRHEALHRCGSGGAAGQCCLEAAAAPEDSEVGSTLPGFIQLALARQVPWGCAPSAIPPKLCCLPVPGSLISGCHQRESKSWKFNQFFSVVPTKTDGTFAMKDKETKSCYTLATGATTPSIAACNASHQQLWKVLNPSSGHYLLQNVASGTCVTARAAKEASAVTMGTCSPSPAGDNSWQPVCDVGGSPLPEWPCLNITGPSPSPHPPSPSPPPPPQPQPQGQPVFLAPCDGTKLNQQWHITSAGQINVGDGKRCLTDGGVVAPCNGTGQTWGPPAPIDGFFQLSSATEEARNSGFNSGVGTSAGHGKCLQVNTPQLFCGSSTSTVCPKAYLQNFTSVS